MTNAPLAGRFSPVPLAGRTISAMLSMITITVLGICLSRRIEPIGSKEWKRIPLARWLLILVYCDSFLFVFITATFNNGFGMEGWPHICEGAQLLCLLCYVTSKLFIYLFLVEKAYIVRGRKTPRLKDKLYLFNFFGMLCPYIGAFVVDFIYRFHYIDHRGLCYMGINRLAMIPTFILEIAANVYLTALFIIPIRKLYSYQHGSLNSSIRTVAVRTFIGSILTLTISAMNLGLLLILEKEPAWMCLMLCNIDILFCALVFHWVTQIDATKEKAPSKYDPENPRSVFYYRSNHDPMDISGIHGGTRAEPLRSGDPDLTVQGVDRPCPLYTGGDRQYSVRTYITAERDGCVELPMEAIAVKTTTITHVPVGPDNDESFKEGTTAEHEERLDSSSSSIEQMVGSRY